MSKESLDKAVKVVVEALLESDIEETDKLELAMNLMTFLNNYNEDLRVLQLNQMKRR